MSVNIALHHVGSNNPDGVEIKKHLDEAGKPVDGVAFHPFHTSKDLVGITVFLIIYFGKINQFREKLVSIINQFQTSFLIGRFLPQRMHTKNSGHCVYFLKTGTSLGVILLS